MGLEEKSYSLRSEPLSFHIPLFEKGDSRRDTLFKSLHLLRYCRVKEEKWHVTQDSVIPHWVEWIHPLFTSFCLDEETKGHHICHPNLDDVDVTPGNITPTPFERCMTYLLLTFLPVLSIKSFRDRVVLDTPRNKYDGHSLWERTSCIFQLRY